MTKKGFLFRQLCSESVRHLIQWQAFSTNVFYGMAAALKESFFLSQLSPVYAGRYAKVVWSGEKREIYG